MRAAETSRMEKRKRKEDASVAWKWCGALFIGETVGVGFETARGAL